MKGQLDLDKPVDEYLTRWQLPASDFDNSQVTVRRLLSHSAGLIDDLGYDGFPSGEPIQTLEASLDQAEDSEYSDGVAIVGYEPGTRYMYSGASYTLLQLLIEELAGQSFTEYMNEEVLIPLEMSNSSFLLADSSKIGLVPIYQTDSTTRTMNRFTAKAAASFMASVADLTRFMQAHLSLNKVLSSDMVEKMSNATSFRNQTPYYGLGPKLFSQHDTKSQVIGHDGSGNNAINTAARVDLLSKKGIIVLETGHWNIASSIADEWLFWQTGVADFVVMQRNKSYILTLLCIGHIVLIGLFLIFYRKVKS